MISAVVLTHNSAATLERTLKSLTWCSEIIVIDDSSTDNSRDIAKKHKATVYMRELKDDFAAQRNFGLEKAAGPWVLFVDSDEVVTGELAKEIETAIQEDGVRGFILRRNDNMFGTWLTHGETSRVRLLRLGSKGSGRWERPVHEVWTMQGEVKELREPLRHYPHSNVAQFLSEINTYSTLNARHLYEQKIHVPIWHIVAYPVAKFFVNYFLYRGFADGTAGAVVAIMMSFHSFLTRAKLWQLWDQASRE